MAGAVLHDAGKIEEFSYDTLPFNYSDRGRLEGHMVLCIQMLQEKIRDLPDFPADKATLLRHLILSHHGRHEFGSPAVPMTLEAFILNLLDDFDAKANFIGRLGSQLEEDEYQWSDYQRTLERFLFVRRPSGIAATAGLRPDREKFRQNKPAAVGSKIRQQRRDGGQSALTFQPMSHELFTFRELLGQEKAKTLLLRARQQRRLGHAYLFRGPGRGREKTGCHHLCRGSQLPARRPGVDACGRCVRPV